MSHLGDSVIADCEWKHGVCVWCGYKTTIPNLRRNCPARTNRKPVRGVGTELAAILQRFWIKDLPGCRCHTHARKMDRNGIDWCESHKRRIVRWMRTEARRRGLPFANAVGYGVLAIAIRRARRNAREASRNA